MCAAISLRSAVGLLVPPLCGVCGAACAGGAPVCRRCEAGLAVTRAEVLDVPGLDSAVAAAAYDGLARDLVRAIKFGGRLALAKHAARAIAAALAPPQPGSGVVSVPPAPARLHRRGFDPAEAIGAALAAELGLRVEPCLAREDGPRQVGRRRRERIADPPRVRLIAEAPATAILVDDVVTTGATLGACARALRRGGCLEVVGAAYAHSPGSLG